jgi:hypothetical protein
LIQLSNELASLGFARDYRDPIEQKFADAMVRQPRRESVLLTPADLEKQQKLADKTWISLVTVSG